MHVDRVFLLSAGEEVWQLEVCVYHISLITGELLRNGRSKVDRTRVSRSGLFLINTLLDKW